MSNTAIVDNSAEAGVIATIVQHPDFILHTDYLKPGYFYNVENGCIYWAISELFKSGVDHIDAMNISNMLNSNKAVQKRMQAHNLTDMNEFMELSQYAARSTVEEYKLLADNVVTAAFKRELNRASKEIERACQDEKTDLDQLNTLVNNRINDVVDKFIVTQDVELYSSKVQNLWDEIVDRRTDNGLYGIPSKFPTISDYLTFEPGELILLKARLKKGKSAFMLNECVDKIRNGVPTLYWDTEMQDRLFHERLLANISGIPAENIKRGRYSYEEGLEIQKANDWLENCKHFVHIYTPMVTDEQIYAVHKKLKYEIGLEFSIFDYLKFNLPTATENYNALGARCDFLKNNIAGDLNLAVFTAAQLNRNDMVADSDKIERYASASMWWRDKDSEQLAHDKLECGNYCLTIDVNRLGKQMADDEYIDFAFDANRMRIVEAKQHPPYDKEPFK